MSDFDSLHAANKARKAAHYEAASARAGDILAAAAKHGWTATPPGPVEQVRHNPTNDGFIYPSGAAYVWTFKRGDTLLQWWPARGKTMINHTRKGPTCTTVDRLLACLRRDSA